MATETQNEAKAIRTVSCGCCTNGCCCGHHMDIPRGRLPKPCAYHADPAHPHPLVTSPLECVQCRYYDEQRPGIGRCLAQNDRTVLARETCERWASPRHPAFSFEGLR